MKCFINGISKIKDLLSIFSISVASVPTFEWDLDRLSTSEIPILKVSLEEDKEVDEVHLEISNLANQDRDLSHEEACLFEGSLKNDPHFKLAASGCPGAQRMEVSLLTEFSSIFLADHFYCIALDGGA